MEKLIFTRKTPREILLTKKPQILNFQNLYSIYLFNHEKKFRKEISSSDNIIFPDGKILSVYLGRPQIRGPTFTRDFFTNKLNKTQKHFIIGPDKKEFSKLVKKFPGLKKSTSYSPPFIKGSIVFPKKEIEKIVKKLKSHKPDYVWVCIGNPKQEILANQLHREYKSWYFNVGAAMDFLLEKKKEAPLIFTNIGLEWFYRLITDFKYTKKKVIRSLLALRYLKKTVSLEK